MLKWLDVAEEEWFTFDGFDEVPTAAALEAIDADENILWSGPFRFQTGGD